MIRQFVSFPEAAALLDTDYEGLRQALELGLGNELRAYVYASVPPFLAYPEGDGVKATASDIHDAISARVSMPGFGEDLYPMDFWGNTFGDEIGEVADCDFPQSTTGRSFTVTLTGYFRVFPNQIRRCALEEHVGVVKVAPESWWAEGAKVPKTPKGNPSVGFVLASTHREDFSRLPTLRELRFRYTDLIALKRARLAPQATISAAGPLKSRERNSLLRIISALAKHAGIETAEATSPRFQ